jgi:prevent-host-death family protein
MSTANMTEVRDQLSDYLDAVEAGEELVITRHGRPVAVIIAHDEYESMVETLNILSDAAAVEAITEAEADIAAGRVDPV